MASDALASRLALWGVDRPPARPEMLLDFIERLVELQPYPAAALSREELEARRLPLQQRVRHSLGLDPWPVCTPLNSRCTGVVERPGYRIEKLIYEAWPGLPVTAHLYVPAQMGGRGPGLVYACGHWMESGKLAEPVQRFCASMGCLGVTTLVYDPIGQGERLGSWRDHGHLNALLVGSSQLGLMVWETIRALDYLETRPEVDPARIGLTGASGGGLNALYAAAIEDRFACIVPVAYPCTFSMAMQAERDLNWEDGVDVCNQVPEVLSYAEMSDLASLSVPRPYMVLAGTRDRLFPVAGVRQVTAAIAHNYGLAGVPERFRFGEHDEEHGYPQSMREEAYGWLLRWLKGEGDGSPVAEPPAELIPDPYIVTYIEPPRPAPGQVRDQSPTVVPVDGSEIGFCRPVDQPVRTQERIDALLVARAAGLPGATSIAAIPEEPGLLGSWQADMRTRMRKVLGPFPPAGDLHARLINQVWAGGMMAERITFESEAGITVPGLFVMPEAWEGAAPVVVYAGEWGKTQGIGDGTVETLLAHGFGVLAVDVRGVGETAATDFEATTNALMTDRPLFGQRVWDLIRAVDFLWERCYIAPQIDKGRLVLAGAGVGGLLALYAAALDGRVAGVVAQGIPLSYRALLPHGAHFPASVYLFDVLRYYDLPQVVAACAPRPVWLSGVDGWRRDLDADTAEEATRGAQAAYRCAGAAPGSLHISSAGHEPVPARWLEQVLEWQGGNPTARRS